jgi:hypothetical protein
VFARFSPDQAFVFVWPEKDRIKRYRWRGDRFDPVFVRGEPPAPRNIDPSHNGMPGGMLSMNIDPSGPSLGLVLASVKICDDTSPPARREPGYKRCDVDQERGALRAYDPFTLKQIWWNQVRV